MEYLGRFEEAARTKHLNLDALQLKEFPVEAVAMTSLK